MKNLLWQVVDFCFTDHPNSTYLVATILSENRGIVLPTYLKGVLHAFLPLKVALHLTTSSIFFVLFSLFVHGWVSTFQLFI